MQQLWWKENAVYQIWPRSFADGDGDGIGDLAGITSRLDYLAALGVDVLWLSPIYPSPQDDAGYDLSDNQDVDPTFGSMERFDALATRDERYSPKCLEEEEMSSRKFVRCTLGASRAAQPTG